MRPARVLRARAARLYQSALASSPRRRARVGENAETRRSPGTARAEVARREAREVGRVGSRARVSGVPRARVGVEAMDDGERISPVTGIERAEAASVAPRRETQRVLFRGASHLNPEHEPELHRLRFLFADNLGERLLFAGTKLPYRKCVHAHSRTASLSLETRMRSNVVVQLQGKLRTRSRGAFARAVLAARRRAALDGRRLLRGDRGRGVRRHPPGAGSRAEPWAAREWAEVARTRPTSRKPRGRIIFARRPRQQRSAHDVES